MALNNLPDALYGYELGQCPAGRFTFEYSGAQYVVAYQGGSNGPVGVPSGSGPNGVNGDWKIHILKSTDGFATHADLAQTALLQPGLNPFKKRVFFTVEVDGTNVYIIWSRYTGTVPGPWTFAGLTVQVFDLVGGALGAANDYNAGSGAPPVKMITERNANSANHFIQLVRRGAGDMLFYFSGSTGGFDDAEYVTFDGSIFGATPTILSPADSTHHAPIGACSSSLTGYSWFLFGWSSAPGRGDTIYAVGMDNAGTVGTVHDVTDDDAMTADFYPNCIVLPITFMDGATEMVGFPSQWYEPAHSDQYGVFWSGAAVLNPIWGMSTITPDQTLIVTGNNDGLTSFGALMAAAYYSGQVTATWQTETTPPISGVKQPQQFYQSVADVSTLTWAAPTKLADAPSTFPASGNQVSMCTLSGGVGTLINWVGNDIGSGLYVDDEVSQYAGGPASTPKNYACAGGSFAQRGNYASAA